MTTDVRMRRWGAVCLLGTLVVVGGCKRHRKTTSAPKSDAYADALKPIVQAQQIKVMHWPNFADYEPLVQTFYDDRNYEVAWVNEDGKPSPQATAFIQAFRTADQKGLNPQDYDAGLWSDRISRMAGKNDADIATFDATMTVSVMRYISDLHVGRVNPTHFNFDINTADKKYNLPEFVSDNAVDAGDVPALIGSVEPQNTQYRALEDALPKYLELAKKEAADARMQQPLPAPPKPLTASAGYPAADALEARLALEGDVAAPAGDEESAPTAATGTTAASPVASSAAAPQTTKQKAALAGAKLGAALKAGKDRVLHGKASSQNATQPSGTQAAAAPVVTKPVGTVYTPELAEGVKHFQARHGIMPDGKLSAQTVAALNVPLTARIVAMDTSLERWRWLPDEYVNAPLMVNLPEFVLRGYKDDHTRDFTMRVVVGKAVGEHDTPVFTHEMKYVIFRPFWNVPTSIIKKELEGHIARSGVGYLESHDFETVSASGEHVNASAAEIEHGGVVVRQKPGPKNSLGLIKFMFPNEYDIYLHSTPAQELFDRTRRDFSHGCIRVQHPDDLGVWVLNRGQAPPGGWTLQQVQDAMNSGPDNHQVNLKQSIPIVIFYLTANIGDDGQVDFFDDIYGYDQQMQAVLAKGPPYPSAQQKVNPNAVTTPGDTD